jgi:hypothetical protein
MQSFALNSKKQIEVNNIVISSALRGLDNISSDYKYIKNRGAGVLGAQNWDIRTIKL